MIRLSYDAVAQVHRNINSRKESGVASHMDHLVFGLRLAPLVIGPLFGALLCYVGIKQVRHPATRVGGIANIILGAALFGAALYFWLGFGK